MIGNVLINSIYKSKLQHDCICVDTRYWRIMHVNCMMDFKHFRCIHVLCHRAQYSNNCLYMSLDMGIVQYSSNFSEVPLCLHSCFVRLLRHHMRSTASVSKNTYTYLSSSFSAQKFTNSTSKVNIFFSFHLQHFASKLCRFTNAMLFIICHSIVIVNLRNFNSNE